MKLNNATRNPVFRGLFAGLVLLLGGCVTAAVGVIAVSSVDIAKDDRSFGTLIDDNVIEANILKDIIADPKLDGNTHISVTVVNSVVLLTGEVAQNSQKSHAGNLANAYQGVDQVVNQLEKMDKSSMTSRSNDTYITAKVKTALIRNTSVNSSTFKVVTSRGVVYLMGVIDPAQGELAVNDAKQVGGVVRIVKIFMTSG
jgi:osmotically-inducible protein OsmY